MVPSISGSQIGAIFVFKDPPPATGGVTPAAESVRAIVEPVTNYTTVTCTATFSINTAGQNMYITTLPGQNVLFGGPTGIVYAAETNIFRIA
jgi:hypothetical protein